MCVLPLALDILSKQKGVRLMGKVLTILAIALVISLTINVALLCILYIKWVNSQIK